MQNEKASARAASASEAQELAELGVVAAAAAIRNGDISSESYAAALLSGHRLPIGMEIDGAPGHDGALLDLARRVQAAVGALPTPR